MLHSSRAPLALASLLAFAFLAGAASAATEAWYLKPSAVASRDTPTGAGVATSVLAEGASLVWRAEPVVASVDLSGQWSYSIELADVGTSLSNTFRVEVGRVSPGGQFHSFGTHTLPIHTAPQIYTGFITATQANIAPPQMLGFRVVNVMDNGLLPETRSFRVLQNDVDTRFNSPANAPGYPTPELPALLLVAVGAVALGGFAMVRARR